MISAVNLNDQLFLVINMYKHQFSLSFLLCFLKKSLLFYLKKTQAVSIATHRLIAVHSSKTSLNQYVLLQSFYVLWSYYVEYVFVFFCVCVYIGSYCSTNLLKKQTTYGMEIDRKEMKKNTQKSDFKKKKSHPLTEKFKFKWKGFCRYVW